MTEVLMIFAGPISFGLGLALGWQFWGKSREPKPHRHDWKFTYMDNAVARYCSSCHEAHIAPYLTPGGQPAQIKWNKP